MSISSILKKFIAGIIALLMPITTSIASNQPNNTQTPNKTDFHASEVHEMPVSEDDFVEADVPTEEEIANAAEAEAPAEEAAPAEETTEPAKEAPTEEAPAETAPEVKEETTQAAAPVAEWDISDTDEDDVHMYYYDEEDTSFLDTVTASVKALFVPITAYAATVETYDGTAAQSKSARTTTDNRYENGTVVISGEGTTDKMVFLNWIDENAFIKDYEIWCENNDLVDDAYILREYIDNDGVLRGESATGEYARGLYAALAEDERNTAMFEDFIPVHFMEFFEENRDTFWNTYGTFIPTRIIIGKDVTSINLFAFAFCNEVTTIEFEEGSKLEEIHSGAFAYTGITDLSIPQATTYIGDSAFSGCNNLTNVLIPGILYECGYAAFADAAKGIRITCAHIFTYCSLMGDSTDGMDVNDNDYDYFEDILYYYGSTATVVLDTTLYNA